MLISESKLIVLYENACKMANVLFSLK